VTILEAGLIRLAANPAYEAVAVPKLNVVVVNHALGNGYRLAIVATDERFKSDEMPVVPNGIRPILGHRGLPTPQLTRTQKYPSVGTIPDSGSTFSN
jgi:hypothetical protein